MIANNISHLRTVPCHWADVLPGTLGWVRRKGVEGFYWERAGLLNIMTHGDQGHDAVVLLDSGQTIRCRMQAFRLQLLTHPAWN